MFPSIKEMLAQMVARRSISSMNPRVDESNFEMIRLLEGWLRELGFATEVIHVSATKANLLAKYGEGAGGLVLSGHTDTVAFDAEGWASDPFELVENDGNLFGLGTCDMKGFFAVVLRAFEQVKTQKFNKPLYVLATADEESTMDGARRLVELGIPKAEFAVIGEPTGLVPVRMHKGIMMESAEVLGRAAHSSQPHLGVNAIEGAHQMMKVLFELSNQWLRIETNDFLGLKRQASWAEFALPHPTLNVGEVSGGDSVNRVCAHCSLAWDVRLMPGMDAQVLQRNLYKQIREAVEPRFGLKLGALLDEVPPFYQERTTFVELVEKLSGSASKAVTFCTEAPFLSQLGMEVVVLGPGHIEVAHQPNEYVSLADLEKARDLFQILIEKICMAKQ